MKKWLLVLLILVVCGAALQLVRPHIDHPPVTADIGAPPAVEAVLRKDCYDCHSNETNLAWFDQVTPANFLVAGHIRMGRAVLNFSNWDSLNKDQRLGKLYESLNQATFGVMPLSDYTRFHPQARVSPEDLAILRDYLVSITPAIHPDTAKARIADVQYAKWISDTVSSDVKPSLNGLNYITGWKNWKAISTTDRFDNFTHRIIFGNDVAIQAIRDGHTNPWPEGTVFAKAAWDQLADTTGQIRAGAYKQVEFMIKKDGQWNFARWVKGLDLAPYGKTALFTTECVNCHKPMLSNDQVFTIPNPTAIREERVITSGVDKRDGLMYTLYGNQPALAAAKAGPGHPYPAGASLSLVTWVEKEDPHWFGGNIPGKVQSVEKVTFDNDGKPVYAATEGSAPAGDRLSFILGQRASVMP